MMRHFVLTMMLMWTLQEEQTCAKECSSTFEDQCLKISCDNSTQRGTYYVCHGGTIAPNTIKTGNTKNDLKSSICASPSHDPREWFEGLNLETFVYDFYHLTSPSQDCSNKFEKNRLKDLSCSNTSDCCMSDRLWNIFGKTACRLDYDCTSGIYTNKTKNEEDPIRSAMKMFAPIYFMIGFIAFAGNVAVIVTSIKVLRQGVSLISKETRAYNILLLHLSTADLIMGVYVMGVATGALNYVISTERQWNSSMNIHAHRTVTWLSFTPCNILGMMNFISSQVSVSALVAITGIRLYGVVFPYKSIRVKSVTGAVATTWIVWVVVAVLPLVKAEPFRSIFTDALKFTGLGEGKKVHYYDLNHLIKKILESINKTCHFSHGRSYELSDWPSWRTLLDVAKKLKIIRAEHLVDCYDLGFYNEQKVCTGKFLIHYSNKSAFFTMFILSSNTLSFFFILLAQIVIAHKSMSNKTAKVSCITRLFCKSHQKQHHTLQRRNLENQRMHRKMFVIVVTDFFCWVPVCILSLMYFAKSANMTICAYFKYRDKTSVWFFPLLMFLLPINSCVNPYLYSSRIWKPIFVKLKVKIRRLCGCTHQQRYDLKSSQTTSTNASSFIELYTKSNNHCVVPTVSARVATSGSTFVQRTG